MVSRREDSRLVRPVRPVREAENRLGRFNRERAALCAQVVDRVIQRRLKVAQRGGDHSLEYVLNDAAFLEIRRLEGKASPAEKKALPEWRDLARHLGTMSEDEKRRRTEALVRDYAEDIAGRFDERVYKFATSLLPTVIGGVLQPRRLTEGLGALGDLAARIVVDGPEAQLHACADRGTLVVAPTHSSNMDSVVIGWALAQRGLPPVTYGAGKNLFSNRLISFFMHNLGAYRVDRRLRHELYKDVLKEYSAVLLEAGYHSLFFPGGTRSRPGALESKLKLGLLGTAITAYQNHLEAGAPQKRIYVVPATINYAIVLEAETLIDDYLAEEGKARYIIEDDEFSSLSRIYDYAKHVLSKPGALHIRFGAPIDVVGNPVDARGDSLAPDGSRLEPADYFTSLGAGTSSGRHDPDRDAQYTRGVGEALTHAYQRLAVLFPTHVVARVLMDHLAHIQGTRDVYRLIRLSRDVDVPDEILRAGVARWRQRIAQAGGAMGEISPSAAPLDDDAFIAAALESFSVYHQRPAAVRGQGVVTVRHVPLCFYYQNRMAHLHDPERGPPVGVSGRREVVA
jgi:glycerol-3-phosphate O-acyltransferase